MTRSRIPSKRTISWAGPRTLLLGDIDNRLDIEDVESDLASLRERLVENLQEDHDQAEGIG